MTAYFIYLLKVSACLLGFYVLYIAVFKHTTLFRLNRYYLLFAMVAAFGIPLIPSELIATRYELMNLPAIDTSFIEMEYEPLLIPKNTMVAGSTVNYVLISCVYFAGVALLFLRLAVTIFRLTRLKSYAQRGQANELMIIRSVLRQPFTFFKWIFIPRRQKVDPLIIEHERAHVLQYHWIDLLLLEIVFILLWFNPLMILYRKAIKLQHEYLADAHMVERGVPLEQYLNLLFDQVQQVSIPVLTNSFYSQSIKQRIMMMTKDKTPQRFFAMYLLLIPATCFMLVAFSGKPEVIETTNNEIVIVEDDHIPSLFPVEITKATRGDGYGERIHPATHKKQMHLGVDFVLLQGEDVIATADGEVIESFNDKYRGNYIIVKHDDIYTTSYSHLKDTTVKRGDKVKKGQVLGHIGSTGLSAIGSHLHYEVLKSGDNVDPKDYLPK